MLGANGTQMLNLMAATRAGRDYDCALRLGIYFFDQWFGHFEGEVVFGLERAECAGHAAATSVQQGCLASWQSFNQLCHKARVEQGFGMTVRVNGHGSGMSVEFQGVGFVVEQVLDKLLKKETSFRHALGVG